MILMWLGSIALMIFAMVESQKYLGAIFSKLQKGIFDKGFSTKLAPLFFQASSSVWLEVSPQRSMFSSLALYNLRVQSLQPSVLVMALSPLGAWWILLLGLLFLKINGFFLMGVSALSLLTVFVSPGFKNVFRWFFFTGLFLVSAELVLKNSSVLQSMMGQSDFAFFLADGRFPTVLALLAVGLLLSLLIQVEFWTFALALGLLVTNTISLNGALGLVAGERIGRMVFFWWMTRSLNQDCRRIGNHLAGISILGAFLGLMVAGELRSYFLSLSLDLSNFQARTFQFTILFAVILMAQMTAQMIWGHFGSRVVIDVVQDAKYITARWQQWGLLSREQTKWSHDKVQKRLSEIRYHLQGLNSLKEGQVPEPIQARLKAEEAQLSGFLHDSN